MRFEVRAWRRAAFVVAALSCASQALADGDAVRVRIDYASDACPRRETFEDALRARARGPIEAPSPGERAKEMIVRIRPRGKRLAGQLTLHEVDGTTSTRTVEGESCNEVSSGLALVAALALEHAEHAAPPTGAGAGGTSGAASGAGTSGAGGTESSTTAGASDASTTSGATPSAETKDAGAPKDASAPGDAGTTERIAEPPHDDTKARDAGDETEDGGSSSRRAHDARWEVSFGLGIGVMVGAAPRPIAVVPPFVEVARRTEKGFAPSARLRFSRGSVGASDPSGPSATFTWTAGDLDLCPLAKDLDAFRLSACMRTELGLLDAMGAHVTPAIDEGRAWFALGLAGRARFVVAKPLFLEAEATFLAPLLRDRFYVLPDKTVFRAAPIAAGGALGLGVVF